MNFVPSKLFFCIKVSVKSRIRNHNFCSVCWVCSVWFFARFANVSNTRWVTSNQLSLPFAAVMNVIYWTSVFLPGLLIGAYNTFISSLSCSIPVSSRVRVLNTITSWPASRPTPIASNGSHGSYLADIGASQWGSGGSVGIEAILWFSCDRASTGTR